MAFLGVYRAIYDYVPQADNEIAIKEGDLLCVLEKGDDDWWKAKKKARSNEEDEPEGLIPNNYVQEATPIATAKALYEYTRQTDEELSFPEEAVLEVFDTTDEDWTLVGLHGEYGFAPANYIEVPEEETPPPMPSRPRPAAEPERAPRRVPTPSPPASPIQSPAAALAGIIQSKSNGNRGGPSRSMPSPPPAVTLPPRKQVQFTPEESDEEQPVPRLPQRQPQRPPDEILRFSPPPLEPKIPKRVAIREPEPESPGTGVLASPPHNRVVSGFYDENSSHHAPGGYHLYNIYEMIEVMGKNRKTPVTLGINIAKGNIMISSEQERESKEWTADKITHYSIEGKHVFMELIRPSRSIDFHAGAKDTAQEIVSALGELAGAAKAEGALREVIAAGSGGQKYGRILYDFKAAGEDEVSVKVDDEVIVIDDVRSSEWWMVRRLKNGKEGVIPSKYVEITGQVMSPTASSSGARGAGSSQSYVEKNRLEEERLARNSSKGGSLEVGPGLQLPERGSSLNQNGNTRRSSQKNRRDSRETGTSEKKPLPNKSKVRTWTDRSGSFKVEAEFIGLRDSKIHLHKLNGVKIAVPVTKMSMEDLEYVENATGESLEEEKLLADIKRKRSQKKVPPAGASIEHTKKPEYDWFDFFLQCGVALQICERYAAAFNKDAMGEENMPGITPVLLRNLGLKEGDNLRVMKFLDNKYGRTREAASTGATGMFTGPGGSLQNNTKKRPTPTNPAGDVVDEDAFKPKTGSTDQKPGSGNSAGPSDKSLLDGFEDNAWTPRESKNAPAQRPAPTPQPSAVPSKPATSTTLGELEGLSLSSPPLQPTIAPQPTIQQQASTPVEQPQQPTGATPSLFDQLARALPQPNQQQSPISARQRPQAPQQMQSQNALIAPPPPRAASAPQNPNQQSAFGVPPLQPQLTGYPGQAQMHTQVAPPGQSLQDLNQQRQFQQQGMLAQAAGYGGFNQGPNGIMPQPTGYGQFPQQQAQGMVFAPYQQAQPTGYSFQQQQLMNGQQTGSPFADPPRAPFQPQQMGMQQPYSPQGMQPQATGINAFLPPALIPQQTGFQNNNGQFNVQGFQAPPVPPIPNQPIAQPLIPQKTGPPPPVRFGVAPGAKKLVPQPTGRRANLAQATPQNPFGF